ncbi:hypothetical protein [Rhizobium sp. MHM7A]|uniref:hypothetical protein n=1 Tax=Rhizobium sp. MHM7A TaxID=2583233 RepID=UPI00110675BA|nr:hypothetical protein [Rhizobium sp. MHM7A]TLX16967.1 hypothetical protein FFR93_06515 [Rhizobium sp. MHM7A]
MLQFDKSRERVFLLMSSVMLREQPAYCPDSNAASFEDAYASFTYATEEAAQAEIKDIIETRRAEYEPDENDEAAEDDAAEDLDDSEEFTRRGIILDDGSIQFTDHPEIEDDIMSVETIFGAYGVEIPDFSAKPSI